MKRYSDLTFDQVAKYQEIVKDEIEREKRARGCETLTAKTIRLLKRSILERCF